MTPKDTPQTPDAEGADRPVGETEVVGPGEAEEFDEVQLLEDEPEGEPYDEAAGEAEEDPAAESAPEADGPAPSSAAEDLRDRSKAFLHALSARSLSARERGEGWEPAVGELAKYRSRWRAALRFVLQRGFFGAVVASNLTTSREVHRRVRTIRGPFVLVANHSSHIDAPMLARCLPWAQARFLSTGVAADYFFNVWYRRLFVRLIFNAFPIDRGGARKHSGTSRKLLRSGVPILVFPEGTRQLDGKLSAFKPGAAALAISVGVPVVPAAIIGAHEAMPKGRSWPLPGRPPVRVVFGEPLVSQEGETAVEFSERIHARVKDLYDEHHDEVLGDAAPGEEESA